MLRTLFLTLALTLQPLYAQTTETTGGGQAVSYDCNHDDEHEDDEDEADTRPPLHIAADNVDLDAVRRLLAEGADVNAEDKNGRTPLFYAVEAGDPACAEALLAAGADVDARDVDGLTPLHHAAEEGADVCAKVLLAAGADAGAKDEDGYTPLHHAAGHGRLEVEKILLAAGADVDAKDESGCTPLHYAVEGEHSETVGPLLAAGAKINARDARGGTPLHHAAGYGALACTASMEMLLKAGADPHAYDRRGRTPWMRIQTEDLAKLREIAALFQTYAGNPPAEPLPDIRGSEATPHDLYDALIALETHPEIMEGMVRTGADLSTAKDETGTPLLHYAILNFRNNPEGVRYLLEHGADMEAKDVDGRTALSVAAALAQPEPLKLLLERGAYVNAQDKDGTSPLHLVLETGTPRPYSVWMLVRYGADPHAKNNKGQSPLDVFELAKKDAWEPPLEVESILRGDYATYRRYKVLNGAANNGDTEKVRQLLDSGLDANSTMTGCPPLTSAARGGHIDTVRFLLERGADAAKCTSGGYTLGAGDDADITRLLVEHGADINAPDAQGRVPLFEALGLLLEDRARLLLELGADPNVADGKGGTLQDILSVCDLSPAIYRELMQHGAVIPSGGGAGLSPLHLAVIAGKKDEVQRLLEAGEDVCARDKRGRTPLYWALALQETESTRMLMERMDLGALEEGQREGLLEAAVMAGDTAALRLMQEHGLDLRATISRSQHLLCSVPKGKTEVMEYLLQHTEDINHTGKCIETPLIHAIGGDDLPTAKLLLDRGADIHAACGISQDTRDDQATALFWAARFGRTAIMDMLLDHGADVERGNDDHRSPLAEAAKAHNPDSVRLLLRRGADVHARDDRGRTALHWAMFFGWGGADCLQTCQALLDAGADINARDAYGRTPLHQAAEYADPGTISYLLEHGADPTAKDYAGKTPLHAIRGIYCHNYDLEEILTCIQLMQNHPANH